MTSRREAEGGNGVGFEKNRLEFGHGEFQFCLA